MVPEDAARLAEGLRAIAARAAGVPGLVTTVDCGIERGTAFVVLEYLTGDALDAHLRQSTPPGLADVQRLLTAIARTIDAAWAQGVSHGAMHPRDIFLGGSLSQVTITGFGLAQALEEVGARTPVRLPYSAPERIAGAEWDLRADIYALGAIAREMTGRSAAGELPAAWKKAIARAMAEDPAVRFDRATDFAEALTPVRVASEPAAVTAPSVASPAARKLETPAALDRMREELAARSVPVLDIPVALVELPRSHHPATAAVVPALPDRFPWAATAAIGAAGVALGLVGGYYWGAARAHRAAAPVVAATPEARTPVVEPPAASTPPETGAAESATPPAPASRRAERPAPAPSRGSLLVDSRPQRASVIMDGKAAGQTPLLIEELSPGMHSVLIQLKGHRPVPSKVAIVAGEQTKLAVSLERLAVVLESLPRKSRR